MIMKTRAKSPQNAVELKVNLNRHDMRFHFPSKLTSDVRTALRDFRFSISFDDACSIWQTRREGMVSLIFDLPSPPRYFKELQEQMKMSHRHTNRTWKADDLWLRQTDMVNHKTDFETISQMAIALKSPIHSINIGRWKTFCLNLEANAETMKALETFRTVLEDHNVHVETVDDFLFMKYSGESVFNKLDVATETGAGALEKELSSIYLPFATRYMLEVCMSNGWLSEYDLDREFVDRLSKMNQRDAVYLLEHVNGLQNRIWNPMDVFDLVVSPRRQWYQNPPDEFIMAYSATVTASTIIFHAPQLELSNRVTRHFRQYSDRFLRIRFEDDKYRGESRIYADTTRVFNEIFGRVRRTLMRGIRVADREYEFVAYGNSQLREHGAYMFARVPPSGENAATIRAWMGKFNHEKIVAKHAARMGQCFSTTRPVGFTVPPVTEQTLIPDIMRNGYNFSDGVGKIGMLLAQMVSSALKFDGQPPSAFQIRLGGCKGVLVTSPDIPPSDMKLRESQFKFSSESKKLEVIRRSEFWHASLNRQLILVLSTLGVRDNVFLEMQQLEIEQLSKAMSDDSAAIEALLSHIDPNRSTVMLSKFVSQGFRQTDEPFVTSLLRLWRAWSMKYLKEKAKLGIKHGALVLGCVDETGTLRGHRADMHGSVLDPAYDNTVLQQQHWKAKPYLPEIFIQVTNPETNKCEVVEGLCIIARNPSLHRGDIRVVKAVKNLKLMHLRDVLVLPSTGDQDLSSMCSGGDLDGDDYVVIWDQRLIPRLWNAEPMDYTPPPAIRVDDDKEVTQNNIVQFYHQYMRNDFLGRIATAHLKFADVKDTGIESEECLRLAELHSKAVDYPKTGVPAAMPEELTVVETPHFMERGGRYRRRTYRSHKILGQLFDAVKRIDFKPNYHANFDERILNAVPITEDHKNFMRSMKNEYDIALQRIMAQHHIKTEFEVCSTFVLDHSKASSDFKFHEEIGRLSFVVKDHARTMIEEEAGGKYLEHLAPYAVAGYTITQEELASSLKAYEAAAEIGNANTVKMPFISFPWVLQSTLCEIAQSSNKGLAVVTVNGTSKRLYDLSLKSNVIGYDSLGGEILADPYQPPKEVTQATGALASLSVEDDNGSDGIGKENMNPIRTQIEADMEENKMRATALDVVPSKGKTQPQYDSDGDEILPDPAAKRKTSTAMDDSDDGELIEDPLLADRS